MAGQGLRFVRIAPQLQLPELQAMLNWILVIPAIFTVTTVAVCAIAAGKAKG